MKLNKYNLIARVYPAVLCSLPILVLYYFTLSKYIGEFFLAIEKYRWMGDVTLSLVLIYLFSQLARFLGKELFEKTHFNGELNMPTTDILLHSDETFSSEHKSRIHSKIASDFNMNICTIQQENNDEHGARKIIIDCVSLVRAKVKDGRLLLQQNTEYGFVRNLIGGSLVAVYVSILNLLLFAYFFPNSIAFGLSLALAVVYLFIIMASKPILTRYGKSYAKILIQEYLLSE